MTHNFETGTPNLATTNTDDLLEELQRRGYEGELRKKLSSDAYKIEQSYRIPDGGAVPLENKFGTNTGHGHVWKRPDGYMAKCGGPSICPMCSKDSKLKTTEVLAQLRSPYHHAGIFVWIGDKHAYRAMSKLDFDSDKDGRWWSRIFDAAMADFGK